MQCMRVDTYAHRAARIEQDRERHRQLKEAVETAPDAHGRRLAQAELHAWQEQQNRSTEAHIEWQLLRWRAMSPHGLKVEQERLRTAFHAATSELQRLLVAADLDLFLAVAAEVLPPQPPLRRGDHCSRQARPRRRRP
jgi:hypothetical protein